MNFPTDGEREKKEGGVVIFVVRWSQRQLWFPAERRCVTASTYTPPYLCLSSHLHSFTPPQDRQIAFTTLHAIGRQQERTSVCVCSVLSICGCCAECILAVGSHTLSS